MRGPSSSGPRAAQPHANVSTERMLKFGYNTESVWIRAAVDGLIALRGTIDRKGDASATLSAHP